MSNDEIQEAYYRMKADEIRRKKADRAIFLSLMVLTLGAGATGNEGLTYVLVTINAIWLYRRGYILQEW